MEKAKRYDVGKDVHFKQLILELCTTHKVITSAPIQNLDGITLFEADKELKPADIEQIKFIKLEKPLDLLLTVESSYSIDELIEDLNHLLSQSKIFSTAMTQIDTLTPVETILAEEEFSSQIAFNLLLCKEAKPSLYSNLLITAAISFLLAQYEKLSEQQTKKLVLAALMHDLGVMHLNSKIFHTKRKLEGREYRYMHVHVILSQLIAEVTPKYRGDIAKTIAQHHERLDGSGYPSGMKGEKITPLGKILAIADVAASKFTSTGDCEHPESLALLFEMNDKKFSPDFYSHLIQLFTESESTLPIRKLSNLSEIKIRVPQLLQLIETWFQIQADAIHKEFVFVQQYIHNLNESLEQSKLCTQNPQKFVNDIIERSELHAHVDSIVEEVIWQLENLLREIKRRKIYDHFQSNLKLHSWLKKVEANTHPLYKA